MIKGFESSLSALCVRVTAVVEASYTSEMLFKREQMLRSAFMC